jgi:uracil-DNA glycosylase family 4
MNLNNLYADSGVGINPLCDGCSILKKNKPEHCIVDYEDVKQVDVLFVTESYTCRNTGKCIPINTQSKRLIEDIIVPLKVSYAFSPSVKCPSVKDADMTSSDRDLCREHLYKTIEAYNPKLVFVCGNMAMKMLLKKSGISNKRGSLFKYEDYNVVPIYHPYSVVVEPKNRFLFEKDINNSVDRYVFGNTKKSDFKYEMLMDLVSVVETCNKLSETKLPLACDIETTGLNFLTDKIMTIAFSTNEGNWVIPIFHKDSPFSEEEAASILEGCVKDVLENPYNRKILQNCKFDIKFLLNYDIKPVNVWDTKIMAHMYNEILPKSLMDLVKLFFPEELDNF